MNILVLGVSGFIGSNIFHSLLEKHSVSVAGRKPIDGYSKYKYLDFSKEMEWESYLENIELVINAIGIMEGDFEKVQTKSPIQFYEACKSKNIKIIHISAIGAEKENPPNEFLRSKKKTDEFLLRYPNAKVVYPGIVIGNRGKSSGFLSEISSLPLVPVISRVTPPTISIYQLIEVVHSIIENFPLFPQQIFAVSKPETFPELFNAIQGKKKRFIFLPKGLIKLLFSIFPKLKIGIFSKEMLNMLLELKAEEYYLHPNNCIHLCKKNNLSFFKSSSLEYTTSSLHLPIQKSSELVLTTAILAISFIWIWSGISSIISWDESYKIMQGIRANHILSVLSIWLGSLVDIALGIAVFSRKYRKNILTMQIFFVVVYTIILSLFAPFYWLHPFGVVAKNIPLLVLSYYVYERVDAIF